MDAYERKLQKARQFSKDPAKVPHREEQFTKAQRRYTYFSDKLVEDLTLLDANRYELAGFLIEGFVEMQEFQSQRQKDVLAGLSSNKLPPKE
jgi:amphiphysin